VVATTILLALVLAFLLTALLLTAWPVSIWATQRYASTWVGLSSEAARSRIGRAEMTEESWAHDGYSGQSFVVRYKLYTLRLMFSDEHKVLHAAIEIDGSPSGAA
jgi:hypothetical protein